MQICKKEFGAHPQKDPSAGYRPPGKHRGSVANINKQYAEDESLMKYNESLGVGADYQKIRLPGHEDDKGRVFFKDFSLMIYENDGANFIKELKVKMNDSDNVQFVIKEGVEFKIKVIFGVQREMVSGLKLRIQFKKGFMPGVTEDYNMGSYAPRDPKECGEGKKFPSVWVTFAPNMLDELPSGMMVRGKYTATCTILDDDENTYAKFKFKFKVQKKWAD